jgi:hypothetical protein
MSVAWDEFSFFNFAFSVAIEFIGAGFVIGSVELARQLVEEVEQEKAQETIDRIEDIVELINTSNQELRREIRSIKEELVTLRSSSERPSSLSLWQKLKRLFGIGR